MSHCVAENVIIKIISQSLPVLFHTSISDFVYFKIFLELQYEMLSYTLWLIF